VLVSYRRELVEDRTAGANRLHADLGKLRPGYHQIIPALRKSRGSRESIECEGGSSIIGC